MKKYLFPALALGLVMTSCQSDEPFAPVEGGEKQVTFTLNVPGDLGTRADFGENKSDKGGLSNNSGVLYYTLVLDAEGDHRTFTETGAGSVTFSPTVVLGRNYTVTAYAQFDNAWNGEAPIEITKHYNDETKDAYFKQENITFQLNETNKQITLKRPFGKLRLLATDYKVDNTNKLNTAVESVTVTYNDAKAAKFNAFNSEFVFDGDYVNTGAKDFGYYDAESDAMPIFADYIPANSDDNMVDFTVTVKYAGSTETYSRTFNDIPVRRNALTTLKGNFFTAGAEIKVEVKDNFETPGIDRNIWDGVTTTEPEYDNTTNTYTVSTGAELAWLAELVNNGTTPNPAPMTRAANNYNFVLTSDIDLGGYQWTPIGTSEKPYTGVFDGNGHTISNLVVNGGSNSYIGLFGNTHNGEIKNLTVENAKVSGRLNVGVVAGQPYTSKYTNITVKGHVEVNGMAYVGAVGGKNAYADWTNITVNVDGTSYVKANSVENGTAYRTYVGGVCGFNGEGGHTFKNITSNIDVKGSTCDVGGLFGIAHYGNKFENCVCTGDVEIYDAGDADEAQEIGGVAGVWHNEAGYTVEFTNCSFTGTLETNIEGVDLSGKTLVGAAYSATGTGKLIINGATAVATVSALQAAVAEEKKVVLLNDLTITPEEMLTAPYGNKMALSHKGGVFNGNGKNISVTANGDNYVVMTNGGTIKNLDIDRGFRGIVLMYPNQDVYVDNVNIGVDDEVCYTINTAEGDGKHDLFVSNSNLYGWCSIGTAVKSVTFTNCKFGQGTYYTDVYGRLVKPYVDAVFEGCEFCSMAYLDLSAFVGTKVILKNCTVNGVKLTAENWTRLVAPEATCGEGQISVELKNGTYLTADNVADYIIIE